MTNATLVVQEPKLKHGDLFETSWGYDQTNYDFLMVLELSKTGKTAKCQMVRAARVGASGVDDLLKPTCSPYGDKFTMRVRTGYRGGVDLRGSYPFCNTGSMENSRLGSFSRVEADRLYSQTNSMFGH